MPSPSEPDNTAANNTAADNTAADDGFFSVRLRLGVAAIGCLLGAFFLDGRTTRGLMFQSAMVRVGLLAGTACLAWPSLQAVRWRPKTRMGRIGLTGLAALTAVRPLLFGPILAALIVLTMFRPGDRGNAQTPPQ